MEQYLYFTFNDISSQDFNCFYTNNGEDLSFPAFSNFSDNKSNPMYQNRSYYLGTTEEDRTFALSCAFDNLELSRFRQMQSWLSKDKIGPLKFDFLPYWHFNVKISKFSNLVMYPLGDGTFYGAFDISFTTINDSAAISDVLYSGYIHVTDNTHTFYDNIDRQYLIPLFDDNPSYTRIPTSEYGHTIRFFNPCNYPYYITMTNLKDDNNNILYPNVFDVSFADKSNPPATISNPAYNKGSNNWYLYNVHYENEGRQSINTLDAIVRSDIGYISLSNNKLLEYYMTDMELSQIINKGIFMVQPGEIKQTIGTITDITHDTEQDHKFSVITMTIDDDSIITSASNSDFYEENSENTDYQAIILQKADITEYNPYGDGGHGYGKYWVADQWNEISYTYIKNEVNTIKIKVKYDKVIETSTQQALHKEDKLLISVLGYTQVRNATRNSVSGEYSYTKTEFSLRNLF